MAIGHHRHLMRDVKAGICGDQEAYTSLMRRVGSPNAVLTFEMKNISPMQLIGRTITDDANRIYFGIDTAFEPTFVMFATSQVQEAASIITHISAFTFELDDDMYDMKHYGYLPVEPVGILSNMHGSMALEFYEAANIISIIQKTFQAHFFVRSTPPLAFPRWNYVRSNMLSVLLK